MKIKVFKFTLLANVLFSIAPCVADPIAIIVNVSNDIHNFRKVDLERIYKGEKNRWKDGQKIVVINRPVNSQIRSVFYKRVFNAKPSLKFFQPNSPIPVKTLVIRSDKAARRFVSHIPNAIGYISLSEVDSSIKVVAIKDW